MFVIILGIICILADQFSKFLVVSYLKGGPGVSIIGDFLNFYYLENRGAAFGILQNSQLIFTLITIIVLIILFFVLLKYYDRASITLKICLGLILGGTIGNFIDRLRLKYVVDFISLKIFNYNFAVFNLADSFIVVGTLLLMLMVLLHENKSTGKKR